MTTNQPMTRVAIVTKYLGPTNYRGARIKADAGEGRKLTISYPHEISGDTNVHAAAAIALCQKMGWDDDDLLGGGTPTGCVFVFATSPRYPTKEHVNG